MIFQVPCEKDGAERYSHSGWGMHDKLCEHSPELWILHAHDQFGDGGCPAVLVCDRCQLSILVVDLQESTSLLAAPRDTSVSASELEP